MPDITGLVGVDGIVPVYNPNGKWEIFGLHEVWQGPDFPGANRYVPKVNDYVIDYESFTTYIVISIDPITLVPTLQEKRPSFMGGVMPETDILFGVNGTNQADTYRIYVDKSTVPYTMAIDSRLKIAGSMSSYCKIFKGSDLGGNGEVISMLFDNSGNFITNNVPLELVAIDNHTNYFIKVPQVCKTNKELNDGELVTVVIYSDNGHVVSKRQLLVENTAFIRSPSYTTKYVSHISLESPFISNTNDHIIDFPLNIPVNALNLIGVVNYSDGSQLRLPVDGNRFKMLGIDQYLSSIEGQQVDLVLSYSLALGEVAYNGIVTNNNYITESYILRTTNPNFSYSVKLFCYPEWVSPVYGYKLNWYLFNLDRNIRYDVTNMIQFNPITGAYDPKDYGVLQRKSVSINLRNVSAAFKNFLHTQVVDISLYGEPDVTTTPWVVAHEANSGRTAYGYELTAKKAAHYDLNISSGILDFEEWKTKTFVHTYPLIDLTRELNPPHPTHIQVRYAGEMREIAIADWNTNITFTTPVSENANVNLTFIKKIASETIYISEAAMIIKP